MRIETAGVQSPGVCSSGYKGNTEGAPWVLPSLSQLALRDPSKAERPAKIKEKQKKEKKTKKTKTTLHNFLGRTSQKGPLKKDLTSPSHFLVSVTMVGCLEYVGLY